MRNKRYMRLPGKKIVQQSTEKEMVTDSSYEILGSKE